MRFNRTQRTMLTVWTGALVMLFTLTGAATAVQPNTAFHGLYWLNEITAEILDANYDGGPDTGKMEPYLKQVSRIRKAVLIGQPAEAYEGMNHLMDMLVARENGVSPARAEKIFDLCYAVTPVRFINIKQYQQRYKKDIAPAEEEFRQDVG